jgi:hypothetical protein
VGTFLGILLCYGVVGQIAARLESIGEMQVQYLQVMRIAIVAFARGSSPILAVEYGRRSIPIELRPSFINMLGQSMHQMPDFEKLKDNVKMALAAKGCGIDLMENAQGTFFVAGSASPITAGESM